MFASCFSVESVDRGSRARVGTLTTSHGLVTTPVFMPVGTQGTVKALTPRQVEETGAQILLGNTYHLNLRPGSDLIRQHGGLHRFMAWERPILTDSGGFQVFSLATLRKITDDGIQFRSHLDGREVLLDPVNVMRIQDNLGSDIAMVIDECPPHGCSLEEAEVAVRRSILWAGACKDQAVQLGFPESGRLVFGIVQGGRFPSLRTRCAEALREIDFPGHAIGGVSVGESEEEMLEQVAHTVPFLPENKPRYVMGVGTPPQLLRMIGMGVDMFDCVMPTREARHGMAYTFDGPINLKNARFRNDEQPLIDGFPNETCRNFSRAYLRHLFVSGEMLSATLLSLHNLSFYAQLMSDAREAIADGRFSTWSEQWIQRYDSGVIS